MESSRPTPEEARRALAGAANAQRQLIEPVALAPGFTVALGVAVAVQIGTAAFELMHDSWAGRIAAVFGFVMLLAVGWWQAAWLRRRRGLTISGVMHYVVLGVNPAAYVVYLAALMVALIGSSDERWALVAVASAAGGAGYAIAGRRWFDRFREDPVAAPPRLAFAVRSLLVFVVVIGVAALSALSR